MPTPSAPPLAAQNLLLFIESDHGAQRMAGADQTLIDKIQALSPERRHEVEDFVDFLADRERGRSLTRAAAAASAPAFAAVWNNPGDDEYDAL